MLGVHATCVVVWWCRNLVTLLRPNDGKTKQPDAPTCADPLPFAALDPVAHVPHHASDQVRTQNQNQNRRRSIRGISCRLPPNNGSHTSLATVTVIVPNGNAMHDRDRREYVYENVVDSPWADHYGRSTQHQANAGTDSYSYSYFCCAQVARSSHAVELDAG